MVPLERGCSHPRGDTSERWHRGCGHPRSDLRLLRLPARHVKKNSFQTDFVLSEFDEPGPAADESFGDTTGVSIVVDQGDSDTSVQGLGGVGYFRTSLEKLNGVSRIAADFDPVDQP